MGRRRPGRRHAPAYDYADYPVKAMQAVEQQGLLGRHLLTTDEWAAYVIDQYWPRQLVFIDDRYDMYPTALAEDYFTVTQIKPGWQDVLDRHQVDVIVWRADRPLAQLLEIASELAADLQGQAVHRVGPAGCRYVAPAVTTTQPRRPPSSAVRP